MSTGKRLAKRSILGTRVAVPGEDGLYHPGVIQAVKTPELSGNHPSRYSVRLDLTRKQREHPETDIIGPGFAGLTGIKLRPGQVVYVTYCNREMQGSVVCHRPNVDQVIIRLLVSSNYEFRIHKVDFRMKLKPKSDILLFVVIIILYFMTTANNKISYFGFNFNRKSTYT